MRRVAIAPRGYGSVGTGDPVGSGKLRVLPGAPLIEVPLTALLLCLPTRKDSVRVRSSLDHLMSKPAPGLLEPLSELLLCLKT